MSLVIPEFVGPWEFLSNGHEGHPFDTQLGDELLGYATGEHLYQALKAQTREEHEYVRLAVKPFGPDGAKKRGRSVRAWPDWEERKYDAMRATLDAKFAYGTELATWLLLTGDALLVEGNTWGDMCWGVNLVTGEGRNWLGTLLMARRAVLRSMG